MGIVGGLRGQTEAQQRHDGAGCVGQIVDGVGQNGDAPRKKPRKEFPGAEQHVDRNAGQPGQTAILPAYLRVAGVLIVFHEKVQEQLCHKSTSFAVYPGHYTPPGREWQAIPVDGAYSCPQPTRPQGGRHSLCPQN